MTTTHVTTLHYTTTMASREAGSVANLAVPKKCNLYNELSNNHHFQPIAFESTGAFSSDALDFIHDLAKLACLIQVTHCPI